MPWTIEGVPARRVSQSHLVTLDRVAILPQTATLVQPDTCCACADGWTGHAAMSDLVVQLFLDAERVSGCFGGGDGFARSCVHTANTSDL